MFRHTFSVLRGLRLLKTPIYNVTRTIPNKFENFSTLCFKTNIITKAELSKTPLIYNHQILDVCRKIESVPVRAVTKFSLKRGKRKTVKAVIKRFFRLHWGCWIRTKVGRHKKMWKKTLAQRRRLRQHVFCNATQSTLLDKMVTKCWKKPKYYVDDPYAPYHTREEFYITRKKPGNH